MACDGDAARRGVTPIQELASGRAMADRGHDECTVRGQSRSGVDRCDQWATRLLADDDHAGAHGSCASGGSEGHADADPGAAAEV
jgi:hypothetical protein